MIKVVITKNKFNIQPETYLQRGKFSEFSQRVRSRQGGRLGRSKRLKGSNQPIENSERKGESKVSTEINLAQVI